MATERPLGEIATIRQGKYLPPDAMAACRSETSPVPVWGANGIIGFTNAPSYDQPVPLVTCRGNGCGMVQWTKGPANISNNAMAIIPISTGINDSRYIYYALLNTDFMPIITGSAQPQITVGHLSTKHVFWCERESERASIAHILGTLDDKIELNRRMNETLEAMARALFKSWFIDFDPVHAKAEGRDTGLPKEIAGLFPDRFVESELGEIPEGWEVGTLGDVAVHLRRGVQPDQISLHTPYIALEHMPKHCIALSDWGTADGLESSKFEFKTGDILFGKLRPYFHKVGVAPVDGVCSTDIVVVVQKAGGWFCFILCHVSSDQFVEYTSASSTGTKMPRTSWGDMARYAIVIPPKPLAEAFTKQMRPEIDRIMSSIHESRTLAALRDTLLPKLISGELRVKATRL